MDDDLTSADQDKWCEMVADIRNALEKRIPTMSDMTPSELDSYMRAMNDCFALEIKANAYDTKLHKELGEL